MISTSRYNYGSATYTMYFRLDTDKKLTNIPYNKTSMTVRMWLLFCCNVVCDYFVTSPWLAEPFALFLMLVPRFMAWTLEKPDQTSLGQTCTWDDSYSLGPFGSIKRTATVGSLPYPWGNAPIRGMSPRLPPTQRCLVWGSQASQLDC